MSKKIKKVSIIFLIFIVIMNSFSVKAFTAEKVDTVETEFVGEFTNLISNKTVVSFLLHTTNDILTKNEIEQIYINNIISDWNVSNVNRVATGDTFKVDGNEYIVVIYGDVNKDGYISTIDDLFINKYTAGTRSLDDEQKIAADVGKIDGYINSIDARVIFEFTVGNRDTVLDSIPYDKQEPLYPQPKEMQAIYGQRLKDIESQLPASNVGTFTFELPKATEVGDVGTHIFTLTFTPNDTQKYKIITGIPVTINVSQAEPNYKKINGLIAIEEQILADIVSQLPVSDLGIYSFVLPIETSVGSVGTHQVEVKYTPIDSNYKPVTFFVTMIVQDKNTVAKVKASEIENAEIYYCEDENIVGEVAASNARGEDLTEKIKAGKIEAVLDCEVTGVYKDEGIDDSNSGAKAKVELNVATGKYEIKLTAQYPGEYTITPIATGNSVSDTLTKEEIKIKVEDKTIVTAIKLIDKETGKELENDTIELYSNRNNENGILVEFYHVYNSGREAKVEKIGKEVTFAKEGEAIQQYTGLCDATESPIDENKEVKSLYVEVIEVTEETTGTLTISVDGVQKVITVKAKPVVTDRLKVNNDVYEIELPEDGTEVEIPVELLDILDGKKTITYPMVKNKPTSDEGTIAVYLANEAYSSKTSLYLTVTPNALTKVETIKLNINTSRVNDENIYEIFKDGIVVEFDSNESQTRRDKIVLIPKNIQDNNTVAKVKASEVENAETYYCEDENVVGEITTSNGRGKDLTEKVKTGKIESVLGCEVTGAYEEEGIDDNNSGVRANVELNEATGKYEIKLTAQYPGEYTITPTAKGNEVSDTLIKEAIKVRIEDKTTVTAIKLIDKETGKELESDTIELYSNRNNENGILVEFYHVYNSGREAKVEKIGKEITLEKASEILEQYTGLCDETESPITENKEVKSLYVEVKEVTEETQGILTISVDGVQKVITVKAKPVATDKLKVNNDMYEIELPEDGTEVEIPVELLDILDGKKTITSAMISKAPTSEKGTIAVYLANEAYASRTPLYLTVTPNSLTNIETIKMNINTSRVNNENIYEIFKDGIVVEFDSNEGRDKIVLIPTNIQDNNTVAKVKAGEVENAETYYCEDENVVGEVTASNSRGVDLTEKIKAGKIESVLGCEVTGVYDDKEITDSNSGVEAKVELNEATGKYEIKLTVQYPGEYTITPTAKGNEVSDILTKETIKVRVEDKTTATAIKLIDKESSKELESDTIELYSNRNNENGILVEFYHVYNSGREIKVEKTGKEVTLEKTGEAIQEYTGLNDATDSQVGENGEKEVKSLFVQVKEVTEETTGTLTISVDGVQKVIIVKAKPVATDKLKVNNDMYEIELPEDGTEIEIPVELLDVLGEKKTIKSTMISKEPTSTAGTIAVYLANETYASKTSLYLTATPNALTKVETIKLKVNTSIVNNGNIYGIFKDGIVFEFDSNESQTRRDKIVLIPTNIQENNTVAKVKASEVKNAETYYCEDENVVGEVAVSNAREEDLTGKIKASEIEAVLGCEVTGVYEDKEITDSNSGVEAKVELNEATGKYEIKLAAQYPGEYTIKPTVAGNLVSDTLTKESIKVKVEDKTTITAIKLIDKETNKEIKDDTIELYSNRNNENGILVEFYHVYNSGREIKVEKTGKEVTLEKTGEAIQEYTGLSDSTDSPITENKEVKSLFVQVEEVTEERIGTLTISVDGMQKVITVKAQPVVADRLKVNNDVYEIELPEAGTEINIPVELLDILGEKKAITSKMINKGPTDTAGTIAVYLANESYRAKTPLYLTVTPNALTNVETIKLKVNTSRVNETNIYEIFKDGIVIEFDSNEIGRDKAILIPTNLQFVSEENTISKLTVTKAISDEPYYCEDEIIVGEVTASNIEGEDLTEKIKASEIEAVLGCEVTGVYDDKKINDSNSEARAKVELNEATGKYEIKLIAQYPGKYRITPIATGNAVNNKISKPSIEVTVKNKITNKEKTENLNNTLDEDEQNLLSKEEELSIVDKIEVVEMPVVKYGENLDYTNAKLKITYSDSSNKEPDVILLNSENVLIDDKDYDNTLVGVEQKIKVTYGEKETIFTIVIKESSTLKNNDIDNTVR